MLGSRLWFSISFIRKIIVRIEFRCCWPPKISQFSECSRKCYNLRAYFAGVYSESSELPFQTYFRWCDGVQDEINHFGKKETKICHHGLCYVRRGEGSFSQKQTDREKFERRWPSSCQRYKTIIIRYMYNEFKEFYVSRFMEFGGEMIRKLDR